MTSTSLMAPAHYLEADRRLNRWGSRDQYGGKMSAQMSRAGEILGVFVRRCREARSNTEWKLTRQPLGFRMGPCMRTAGMPNPDQLRDIKEERGR